VAEEARGPHKDRIRGAEHASVAPEARPSRPDRPYGLQMLEYGAGGRPWVAAQRAASCCFLRAADAADTASSVPRAPTAAPGATALSALDSAFGTTPKNVGRAGFGRRCRSASARSAAVSFSKA
jgi:hypothetical protein